MKGDGQTLNGFHRTTGLRNRCNKCDSKYHLAPKCPWREVPRSEIGTSSSVNGKARSPSYFAIFMKTPTTVQTVNTSGDGETSSEGEQFCSTAMDVGGLFAPAESDSVAISANLICFG